MLVDFHLIVQQKQKKSKEKRNASANKIHVHTSGDFPATDVTILQKWFIESQRLGIVGVSTAKRQHAARQQQEKSTAHVAVREIPTPPG